MKKVLSFFFEIAQIVLIAVIVVAPIRYFLFQPFFVRGDSMEPNFRNGDYLIVDEISYRFRQPERGEVIVFKYPQNLSERFIKRVIGLPGETVAVKDNKVSIIKDGKEIILDEAIYLPSSLPTMGDENITLGKDQYFVLGDNRPNSYDSRRFGVVPKNDIIGKVLFRAWPISSVEAFNAPNYSNN